MALYKHRVSGESPRRGQAYPQGWHDDVFPSCVNAHDQGRWAVSFSISAQFRLTFSLSIFNTGEMLDTDSMTSLRNPPSVNGLV